MLTSDTALKRASSGGWRTPQASVTDSPLKLQASGLGASFSPIDRLATQTSLVREDSADAHSFSLHSQPLQDLLPWLLDDLLFELTAGVNASNRRSIVLSI